MTNAEIASALAQVAELLDQAGASGEQVRAYQAAASTIRRLQRPVRQVVAEEGEAGLKRLEHVTDRMAEAIQELVASGRLQHLDELRAEVEPEEVLDAIRGIGNALARQIERELGIVTVEELARAAADGRLVRLRGIGPARAARIAPALAERMARRPSSVLAPPAPVAELLGVDQEYRQRAAAGELHRIAPRRYNPKRDAWVPVLHCERDGRRYTALFANTHLAHTLGHTKDGVILYYQDAEGRVGQAMVVTERQGDLAGRRVVRGREGELIRESS